MKYINVNKSQWLFFLVIFFLGLGTLKAEETGEQSQQFGPYKVYYNSFNTSFLSAEMARQYHIKRSAKTGLINISVRKNMGKDSKPVKVKISGIFKNLLSQSQGLEFKIVEEKDAVYYLALFNFDDQDRLNFEIKLDLDENYQNKIVKFSNQFYRD